MSVVLQPPKTQISYRKAPPFNSETGKAAGRKGSKARWERYRQIVNDIDSIEKVAEELTHPNSKPCLGQVALMRRAVRRFIQMSISSTDSVEIQRLMASAREAFDMERLLLGKETLPQKSTSKRKSKSIPSLPDFPLPDSGNQSVPTPIAKPESESQPPVTDDTPF